MHLAKRLNEFEAYLGTAMNLILTRMREEGKDVINLGLGDPDVIPPEPMRQSLADACYDSNNHHYPSFYSPMPLKEAIAGWYERQYEVKCDPEKEVLPLLGSADGLFHIHTCLLDPGGVCLHRGCIPSKTLLHVSRLLNEANGAKQYGITFGKPKIDIDRLRSWKNHVVEQLTGGLGQLCVRRKVNFVRGKAQFVGPTNLKVTGADGDSHCLEFQHAIIATGSHPIPVPGFPEDSPHIMGSSGALSLEKIPETLCVVGGGYIGLELGTVYAALGSKVTVVEMLSSLLPGADRDLVRFLVKPLKEKFSTIMTDTKVARVETQERGIRLFFENKSGEVSDQWFEKVLVSIGRRPNAKGLGIENTAIETDTKGFIKTDVLKCTREPSIYAVGDATSQPMLAHKASHEGRIAVEAIRGNKPAFESRVIPAVVFCDPEIAWCGLTEREAKAQSRNYTTTRFP